MNSVLNIMVAEIVCGYRRYTRDKDLGPKFAFTILLPPNTPDLVEDPMGYGGKFVSDPEGIPYKGCLKVPDYANEAGCRDNMIDALRQQGFYISQASELAADGKSYMGPWKVRVGDTIICDAQYTLGQAYCIASLLAKGADKQSIHDAVSQKYGSAKIARGC